MQKLNGQAIDGITRVILLLVTIGGAILLGLGIVGHYTARLYDKVKRRSLFVIKPAARLPEDVGNQPRKTVERPDRKL